MKTTVVIPNYNGKHFLQDCLDSLFQSTVEIAVIVVDNGSTDGSVSWIQEHFPQVKLICFSENKGFCTAVNTGIGAAATPYVFLLNNDTKTDRFCLERLETVSYTHLNCRYDFSLLLKKVEAGYIAPGSSTEAIPEDRGEVWRIPCTRQFRPDIDENLHGIVHTELPGVCVTFDRDSLPEGDYLIGFLWEDTCSVSYTHLDVYKRQVVRCAAFRRE